MDNALKVIQYLMIVLRILIYALGYAFLILLMVCLFVHSLNSKAGKFNRFSSFVLATGIFSLLSNHSKKLSSNRAWVKK
jgi:cytochrome c biogenesis protein CcdA